MKKGSYWFGFLSEKEQEEFKQNFLIQTKKEAYIQSFETPFESYYLELEFEIINRLNDSGFQGAFKINGDSILFGWHEGELNNINSISIARVLRKNKFYATYHRINEWTYFKKYPGFIDESCGLLFVSNGSEIPNEIKVFELLVDNGLNGKWYFVEAKI